MLRCFSYSDEIVLFWDKKRDDATLYEIFVNGEIIGKSTRTFFRIHNLEQDTLYRLSIKAKTENGQTVYVYNKLYRTKKKKHDIIVTEYPYYAVGDGKTTNTFALQHAIDDCRKNERVVIPKGVFKTGALRLQSDTEIYIEEGGVILGSDKKEDYLPMIASRFEGRENKSYSSLINFGYLNRTGKPNVRNIIIHGKGKIVGGGEELLFDTLDIQGETIDEKKQKLLCYQEQLGSDKEEKHRLRGRLINASNAKNIIIDGLELGNSPSWNIHLIYSENVITCGCKIFSQGIWNGDGWDPDSSRNCTLFDCEFDTGDDCIAIKSGKNPEGNIINIPTENIDIFACGVKKGRSHGVAIGSEVSGGIKNIRMWDCDFSNSFFGVHIKTTKKRGGYIKNVEVKDSKISRVMIREVGYNDDGEGSSELTEISGINFGNVLIEYNSGDPNFGIEADTYVYVKGFDGNPEKVNNIKFDKLTINNKENLKEYDMNNCSDVVFNGIKIK